MKKVNPNKSDYSKFTDEQLMKMYNAACVSTSRQAGARMTKIGRELRKRR